MSNERIYTDLCDKNGKKLYIGDNIRFTVEPFNYSYEGVIILIGGGIFIQYFEDIPVSATLSGARLHPLYLVNDEDHDMYTTISVHYVYEKIIKNEV